MNLFFKLLLTASWVFAIVWAWHIRATIGLDAVMPMKLKLPLVLSVFGPTLLWLIYGLYIIGKRQLNDTIEDKMNINR